MTMPFLDTNIIIRLFTGDDPVKQEASARLFEQIERGSLTVAAPDTAIADAVYGLCSPRLYHLPRVQISGIVPTDLR